MTMNGTLAQAEEIVATGRRQCLGVEGEMTELDGLITALRIVRWSDELVLDMTPGAEAGARKLDHALQGLFAVIDATVAQAARLHRAVHGEAEPDESEGDDE
jgi:hypothetical protein